MILLISPYQNAHDCAALIERSTHEQVKTVDSIRLGLSAIRTQEFSAVVADENLLDCSPGSAEALEARMGQALPVFIDMACMKPERITRLVESAIRRCELQYRSAREKAIADLGSELKSELTGLLLSSEMVLETTNVPPALGEMLTLVLDSAKRIKSRFEK